MYDTTGDTYHFHLSIYIPLILVMDRSNTKEDSQVTLRGLGWEVKRDEGFPYRSRIKSGKRLKDESCEMVIGCQGSVPVKQCQTCLEQDNIW